MANEPMQAPTEPWMHRLRRGHLIWLVKENERAQVEWPWEPPEPGRITGRLGILRYQRHLGLHATFVAEQTWYVGSCGEGLDGLPLIQPCVGNLPENPPELPASSSREILQALDRLQRRLAILERQQRNYIRIDPTAEMQAYEDRRFIETVNAVLAEGSQPAVDLDASIEQIQRQLRGIRIRKTV